MKHCRLRSCGESETHCALHAALLWYAFDQHHHASGALLRLRLRSVAALAKRQGCRCRKRKNLGIIRRNPVFEHKATFSNISCYDASSSYDFTLCCRSPPRPVVEHQSLIPVVKKRLGFGYQHKDSDELIPLQVAMPYGPVCVKNDLFSLRTFPMNSIQFNSVEFIYLHPQNAVGPTEK